MLRKYAELLVNYSLYIKSGETLYINTTTLAEPLVREIYALAIAKGAQVEVQFDFEGKSEAFFENASEDQLSTPPIFHKIAMEEFDAYLYIKAPYISSDYKIDSDKRNLRSESLKNINQTYFERTANGSMKRSLCQYPTENDAKLAGMTLDEYSKFIFQACKLYEPNPIEAWQKVSSDQQKYVDYLNGVKKIEYINKSSHIEFSVEGRTWINSDGKTNMPSGEVFSSPVENSVNGHIFFDYPSIYQGEEVQGIYLEVRDGIVVKWSAEKGQSLLDKLLTLPGANQFGEVAIGTNYSIQIPTKNILFDEKIGGSIHMALGQSYGQTGGLNQSSIHWDMICDMRNEGQILADGNLIYENGYFII